MKARTELSADEVRAHALRLLARREYSVGELSNKLLTRCRDRSSVDTVVAALADEDLVSDSRFARSFVRSRVAKYQGPRKIRAQLSQRRVSDSLIDQALSEVELSWTALAADWLERSEGGVPPAEKRPGCYRRLINRGFTHDQAMDAINGRVESPG